MTEPKTQLNAVIRGRRSIRRYKPDKISRDKILELLETASYAPSACNLQAWRFVVVDDDDIKRRVVEKGRVNRQVLSAPVVIAAAYNRSVTRENFAGYQSLAAAIQNLLLAASCDGLGTLWVCNFENEEGIRDLLGIPDLYRVAALIEIGIPDAAPPAPLRKPPSDFVSFNHFRENGSIPGTTTLDDWRWEEILDWQDGYARRGYPLRKVSSDEIRLLADLMGPHLTGGGITEVFAQDCHLSGELMRRGQEVRLHFSSDEIRQAASRFEEAAAGAEAIIGEKAIIETEPAAPDAAIPDPPDSGMNYLLFKILEHMPEGVASNLLSSLSKRAAGGRIFIVHHGRWSWYGLWDAFNRRVRGRKGIDDIFFGSLRSQGPWRLLSHREVKRLLSRAGLRIEKRYGLFVTPAHRFAGSEWLASRGTGIRSAFAFIALILALIERIAGLTGLDRILGEENLIVAGRKTGDA